MYSFSTCALGQMRLESKHCGDHSSSRERNEIYQHEDIMSRQCIFNIQPGQTDQGVSPVYAGVMRKATAPRTHHPRKKSKMVCFQALPVRRIR